MLRTIIWYVVDVLMSLTTPPPPSEGGSLLGGRGGVELFLRMRLHSEEERNAVIIINNEVILCAAHIYDKYISTLVYSITCCAQLFGMLLMYQCHLPRRNWYD